MSRSSAHPRRSGSGRSPWPAWLLGALFLLLSATLHAQVSVGAACGPVPATYPIVAGSSSNLDFDGSATMNSNSISGSGNVVRTTGSRTNASVALPPLDPSAFPSFGGSINANSSPVAPGTYASVNVNSAGFTFTGGGTYYIGNMNVNASSLVFGPGVYYIRSLSLNNNTTITVSSGPVKIYLGGSVSSRDNVSVNAGGDPADLAVFIYGNQSFEAGDNFTFTGLLYTPGTGRIRVRDDARITGAVIGRGQVRFGNNVRITATSSTLAAIATISTCATVPTVTVTSEYRFDECSYDGTSNEVRDSAGSSHGTARNGLTTTASGVIGSAAEIDRYDKWISTSIPLARDWSVSVWLNLPPDTAGRSRYHVLGSIAGGGDLAYFDNANRFRWGVYTTSRTVDGAYQLNSAGSGWHHLVLVAEGTSTRMYIDGRLVDTLSNKLNGGTLSYLGTSYDSVDTRDAQGMRASIDELLVFDGVLDASAVADIYTNQSAGLNYDGTKRSATGCGIARFVVTASASASTCVGHSVTITALDASGNLATGYTGTVLLRTSTNRGGWSAGASSGGVTETGTSNDGAASYTFRPSDLGSVTLTLANESADDVTITATDSVTSTITGTSGAVSFRDNAFVIDTVDALGTTAVAGRPHAMTVTLYRRDTSLGTPNCAVATGYTGNRSLKGWYVADTDHPSGATAPAINGGTALPASLPGANNVSLAFAAGVASFNLTTSDVGKFVLNLRDDSRSFASGTNIDGSSGTLTVRPFALAVTGISKGATSNPEGTATSGSRFVRAGETFSATVGAYLWQPADDADNDGAPDTGANVLDNGFAARFAWPVGLSVGTTPGFFTPGGGNVGTLSGTTSIPAPGFSGGAATVSDLVYSEVGSIALGVTGSAYLNTAGVTLSGTAVNDSTGQAARVGRFYPDHFTLLSGALVSAACTAGGFTYMDEPGIGVQFTLEARNAANGVVTNYQSSVYSAGTVSLVAENADSGVSLASRLSTLPPVSWTAGRYVMGATDLTFARQSAPDGPFDSLVLGVTVSDPDGTPLAAPDMNPATAGSCGGACTAAALNAGSATRVRFGRLRIGNALGAPQLPLPVPMTLEYWTGVAFATHALDSCLRLTNTQVTFGNFRAPLGACNTSGTPAGSGGIVFSSGRGAFRLSAPGLGGSVDLSVNLGATASGSTCSGGVASSATAASRPWLRGNWGASTYDRNPAARAVFGRHTNSSDVIFLRESY